MPTTKDLVRFLICDTDVDPESDASVTDEEINAMLSLHGSNGEQAAYCVAAEILSKLLAKFTVRGMKTGLVSKVVDNLRLQFGTSVSTAQLLTDRVNHLRGKCIALSGSLFQTIGPSSRKGCRGRKFSA